MAVGEQTLGLSHLTERLLRLARLAWYPFAALGLGVLIASLPGYLKMLPDGPHAGNLVVGYSPALVAANMVFVVASLGVALLSLTLAWVLVRNRGDDSMALLLGYYMLTHAIILSGPAEALELSLTGSQGFSTYVLQPAITLPLICAVLALFPDGHFVPPWTRWVVLSSLVFGPLSYYLSFRAGVNPAGPLFIFGSLLWLGLSIALIYAQAYRYRHVSTLEQRQQTKWVLYGLCAWISMIILSTGPYLYLESLPSGSSYPWWAPGATIFWVLSTATIPVSLVLAIQQFRLYEIDIVINRTLVYGGLTTMVVGLYVLVVGGLSSLFQTTGSLVISLIGTGLVAVLVNPLRERLQRGVNRIMYGQRDEPVEVLSRLGERLEASQASEAVLEAIVEVGAQALKLPYAAVEVTYAGGRQVVAVYGAHRGELVRFPLVYQSETLGDLALAPRSSGETFSPADRNLLENIARQAGAAVHAMRLTEDLRRSRQRLIATREEERRRLRRDLHDGLGPTLASQTLNLDAARNLLKANPEAAERLLHELKNQTQETLKDIRRLVYNLRPPALDDLGLIPAVRAFAEQQTTNGVQVAVFGPDVLPPLPAAVEVAAYRIALEALTNVIRHAKASHIEVRFSMDDNLQVGVKDDGEGLPEGFAAGVGMASMRERAEELGGSFEVSSEPGKGTQVSAWLPFDEVGHDG